MPCFGLMTVTFTVAQTDEHQLTHAPVAATSVTYDDHFPLTFSACPVTAMCCSELRGRPADLRMRLWDTGTGWGQINTASGVYDWTTLDSWIAAAGTHNDQLIFTFGMTPTWASSKHRRMPVATTASDSAIRRLISRLTEQEPINTSSTSLRRSRSTLPASRTGRCGIHLTTLRSGREPTPNSYAWSKTRVPTSRNTFPAQRSSLQRTASSTIRTLFELHHA